MKRLVVIGAGISGLAAAHTAVQKVNGGAGQVPGGLEVIVLERDSRAGGKVRTIREDGWCIEAGPTGFLDTEQEVRDLASDVGLELLPASLAAARRFLVRRGKLAEIKASPIGFMKSRILGPLGVLRIAAEPFIRRRPADAGDESIWDFAARRLGEEAADRLIAPMTLGIFAGDARRLSLEAAFPKLHELEREHGSLIRGMIARKRAKAGGGGPAGPAGWLTSFGQGLEQLPAALENQSGVKVRLGAAVNSVIPDPDGGFKVLVEGDGEPLPADAVILAGEAWAMAPVLHEAVPEAATNLATIPCPPVIVVALGYGPDALAKVPRGFGALIARTEGYRILGCLWDTHLFAGRSPDGKLLLRVMLGGSVDAPVADLDDDAILETVLDDLRRLLAIEEKPLLEKVIRWQRAIPQYELGHLGRARVIEDSLARLPGLYMAGNALHGVAFTKAATLGMQRAREALAFLSE